MAHDRTAGVASRAPWIQAAMVWLVSVLLFTPPYLVDVNVHDEGLIATGAMLIHRGWLPYRDFLSFYGPAQYYLLAGSFAIFGENLLVLRALHVCWLGGLIVAVWALARTFASAAANPPASAADTDILRARLADLPRYTVPIVVGAAFALVLFALPNPGYPAIPATLFLLLAARALCDWDPRHGHAVESRRLLAASTLVGVAGAFRWDFGLFAMLALAATVVFAMWSAQASWRELLRSAVLAGVPALALIAVCYAPLLAVAPRFYNDIVAYAAFEFPKWRQIEFIRPAYWKALHALDTGETQGVLDGTARLCFAALPPAVLIGTLVTAGLRRLRALRAVPWTPTPVASRYARAYLTILGLLLLQQMRVRPTLWQGFPAAIVALVLAVFVVQAAERLLRGRRTVWLLRTASAFGVALLLLAAWPHVQGAVRTDAVPLDAARASLVRVPGERAHYAALVRYLRDHTAEREALYSGAADHSQLYICDSLLYFLTGRMPADRFMELEPGIANTPSGQRHIRDALDARRVPLIVLTAIRSREANLTAASNGVSLLDTFIRRHYTPEAVFGPYTVLRRRAE